MRGCRAILGVLWLVWAGPSEGADAEFKGMVFGDYYFIASGAREKENGFRVRRVYLTHDLRWNKAIAGRVRLEANDGGFNSQKKLEVYLKNVYLHVKNDRHAIYVGLSGTPTWNVSEAAWGYRSVQKTMMDRNKIASSTDMGIAYRGRLDGDGKVNARLTLGNGSGVRSEENNGKRIYGLLHFKPSALNATAYADWERRGGGEDRTTVAAFVGLMDRKFHGGVEGFVQWRNVDNTQVRGISLFGTGRISRKAKVFVRGDLFDPNDQSGKDHEYFFLGGVDYEPARDVHVMPNVLVAQVGDDEAEVIPRLTLFVKF